MTTIERSALVAFSAQEMFDLVSDVERYPEFMPGCVKTDLIGRGDDWLEAKLHLGRGRLNTSFTTHNVVDAPNRMELSLTEGPFKSFHGVWTFTELAERACKLELKLEFEFSNKLIAMAAGRLFESMANQQVDAICQRARQIYAE
ncbi:type II toxin-antitoxin system RatA family toxin [Halioxenophilus aromaticivorans]|uniref:SRPBCC family protein n=1 Tax=Halioxenophilus aromaticivorans TaxID=1306992 RepID=A0AAV3U4U7_9ALTE